MVYSGLAHASPASALADDPIKKLTGKQLTTLVQELETFYRQSLETLYSINKDEAERQLGTRIVARLMANYDERVAGRCTKVLIGQALNQYILGAQARMTRPEQDTATDSPAAKSTQDYTALLAKYGLARENLRQTNDCTVFEYDFEPLYEAPITVANPGWWFLNQDRKTKTFIRITVKKQNADGSAELEAYVAGGRPKGRYTGFAKRELHSTSIQVSLMRVGSPMLIDGELTMTGANYQDPLTNEPAPKMPARVLSGFLTVRDQPRFAVNNAVMLVARESDTTISRALEGFKVPGDASYGSYLNIVVVSFRGLNMSRDYMKFAGLIDDAYKSVQKDNPVQSFHPTRKPLFVNDAEAAFVVIDVASDVNALAVRKLRSRQVAAAAKALGASQVDVFPFYKVKKGKLRVSLSGRPASEIKFENFEGLARALFTMYAALAQEQQVIFEKHGIKKLSDEVLSMQKDLEDLFKAMGPALDILLTGQEYTEELDKKLMSAMQELAAMRDGINITLSTILDTRKVHALVRQYTEFFAKQREILEIANAGAPADRAEPNKALIDKLNSGAELMMARVQRFSKTVIKNQDAIAVCLNYMNLFTVRIELGGQYVDRAGRLKSFDWKWERTLPRELEVIFNGGANEKKSVERPGRRGN